MAWVAPLSAILVALLTAVVGNRLVHVWQQRSWRHQQQFQGLEKEYNALKTLTENIAKECGLRLSAMREINAALPRREFENELLKYREAISEWNRNIHGHYAQLTFQMGWKYVVELENIHKSFVSASSLLDGEIRSSIKSNTFSGGALAKVELMLNAASGRTALFLRDLTRKTEERRQEVFYGTELKYNNLDIVRLTNFELIKLIFNSNVDEFSIVRPSYNVSAPLGRGL